MSDLIDRQAAIDALENVLVSEELEYAIPALEELPSAERKGKWITYYHGGTDFSYSCNQCGAGAPFLWKSSIQKKSKYCYNCGVKMEVSD